jgi:hypothetical protein
METERKMNISLQRNNSTYPGVFLGLLTGLIWIMLIIPLSVQAGPVLEIDETIYSAGEVFAGDVVEHRFLVSNAGDAPLEVQRVRSS